MDRTFNWPSGLVLPRDSRTVETPVDGSGEKVVSELFPTAAITGVYPVIGTTTYANLTPANKALEDLTTMEFGTYILRKSEKIPNSPFTRLYFTSGIVNPLAATPFWTEEEFDPDFYWPPILYKVIFLIDQANPIVTRGPGGIEIYSNRYVPRSFYTDEQRGALILKEHYVSDVPFTGVGDYDTPKPTTVQYEYSNVRDIFRACLHGKLVFDTKQTAIVGYDAAAATAVSVAGSLRGQIFEATNFEEWETHSFKFESIKRDILFEGIRSVAVAPDIPEISLA